MSENADGPAEEPLPLGVLREGEGYRFSWRMPLLMVGLALAVMAITNHVVLHLVIGAPNKPLLTLSLWAPFAAAAIASGLRQQRSLKGGVLKPPWYRFSILEAMVITTGFAFSFALQAVDREAVLHEHQSVERLNKESASLLGPDSHIYRNSEGIHVSLCDRTVDDSRLAEFTDLADEIGVLDRITTFRIGSNARNINTPAVWPNLTDASIRALLRWSRLRELHLHGSQITERGAIQLTELPRLRWLEITKGFGPENAAEIKRRRPDLRIDRAGDFP